MSIINAGRGCEMALVVCVAQPMSLILSVFRSVGLS